MRILSFVLIVSLLSGIHVFAQVESRQTFQGSTHMLSIDEMGKQGEMARSFTPTAAPVQPVRNVAEFEKMDGVIISYPGQFGLPTDLIVEMSQNHNVYILVETQSQQNSITTQAQGAGADMSNIIFHIVDLNSYWIRDYGPWFVFDGNGDPGIVDFPYNRPRPDDNNIPAFFAGELSINLFGMDLTHTGGNYMTTGMGISASTDLVGEENPGMSAYDIDTTVQNYLGISNYFQMYDPMDDYIKHVDCWAKFLAVDKVLVAEVPPSDYRYNDYEDAANYFANAISPYGTNFQVYRAYSPNGEPYTNSLIVNRNVYVPIMNGSQWNDSALAVYQEALPGYTIQGFVNNTWNGWESTDALHCRTRGLIDIGMLYVEHIPLFGEQLFQTEYDISAKIIAHSDSMLYNDSLLVYYSIDSAAYQSVVMTMDSTNYYTGLIPVQAGDSIVDYYIFAADKSGRNAMHPFVAYDNPHRFTVEQVPISTVMENSMFNDEIVVFQSNAARIIKLRAYPSNCEILDISGRVLQSSKIVDNSFHTFNLNKYPAGMYLVKLSEGNSTRTKKFILK